MCSELEIKKIIYKKTLNETIDSCNTVTNKLFFFSEEKLKTKRSKKKCFAVKLSDKQNNVEKSIWYLFIFISFLAK